MNARIIPCAILMGLGWACAVAASAQEMLPVPGVQPPPIQRDQPKVSDATPGASMPLPNEGPGGAPGLSGLSDWILYRRPGSDCCDPGPLKPIYSEAYLRVGPSAPVGGNYLGRQLLLGWSIEGGFRALFFDQSTTNAWVVDIGVINTNNGALNPGAISVPLNVAQPPPNPVTGLNTFSTVQATVHNYNRTMASLGIGREYYIWAPADASLGKWRIGWDGGGRYGSANMTFNEIRHRTRTAEAIYLAAHTDYEIPCGCCYIAIGLRCEWSYTWCTILQRQSDLQDITGLVTFSVRY
jgi:hypothetical protein